MIDSESKKLYEDASSSLIDAFSKFLKFVKYEDEIADGLTGIAYIFFYENIAFSFENGVIMVDSFKITEMHRADSTLLAASNDKEKREETPYEIYKWIKESI